MILSLVRHGESAFNAEGRIQGQLDVPLSAVGRRQAAAVAELLALEPVDAVYSSPLARALETARVIAARHGCDIRLDDRLKEIHAGVFQGLSRSEMAAQYPDESRAWMARQPDFRIPGGETRRELMLRGRAVLEDIRRAGHDHAIVVAHGGVLSAALKGLLEIPVERGPFHFYNAALTRLLWHEEIVIDVLNQTDHLRELGKGGYGDL